MSIYLIAISGIVIGTPVKSSVAAKQNSANGASGWVNPYVTDGLVAMLDGIWNVGGGEHDANASIWKDLSGNDNDGALTSYSSVGSDSMLITGRSGVPITMSGAITDAYTIEVIARMVAWESAPRLTAEYPYPSLYFSSSSSVSAHIAFYGQGQDRGMGYLVDRTQRFSYCMTYDGATLTPFVDGEQHGDIVSTTTRPTSVPTASLGNRVAGARGFDGEICAFRRYNRALTAEEIAHNYAIDKERFNLP